eukprot:15327288-Ditylum_brightwellii.AAC.1
MAKKDIFILLDKLYIPDSIRESISNGDGITDAGADAMSSSSEDSNISQMKDPIHDDKSGESQVDPDFMPH